MRTIILSINSQYVHTLLAPRYLLSNMDSTEAEILETNVNVDINSVLQDLITKKPDIVAISCYIFNIAFIRKLLPMLRNSLKNVVIIMGGYEAAFDSERYEGVADYIIKGEGDKIFDVLIKDIESGKKLFPKVIEAGTVKNLDEIKSPYSESYSILGKNKILYMETNRGCPFSCSYCMSANTLSVRAFSLNRVFDDLAKITIYNPKQIKLVDRTFNYNIKRATKIFEHIIDNYEGRGINFHFEMAPELFDEEMFLTLSKAKKGLLRFEIGVQTYNEKTLTKIHRKADIERIDSNLNRLIKMQNIQIHVDLIAGLPEENFASFVSGFDRLIKLRPHCLQLGFLKILKGSKISEEAIGYQIQNTPPYEIIASPCISERELNKLKKAEEALELYYNSQRFCCAMDYIFPYLYSPYDFFEGLGEILEVKYGGKKATSSYTQSDCLFNFCLDYLQKGIESEEKQEYFYGLELCINKDFALSGNIRKWKRHLPS